jgi:hypothetical protein
MIVVFAPGRKYSVWSEPTRLLLAVLLDRG